MEATDDPGVVITSRADGLVVYAAQDGTRWVIRGVCNRCGSCEVDETGAHIVWSGPPGTPGACTDTRMPGRLDSPVRPEGVSRWEGCSLSGEYL